MRKDRECILHTAEEIVHIRRAAELTAQVRDALPKACVPGMSTLELDEIAGCLIARTGGKSAFLGYGGFPGNICISVNEEVVHGIGRADRILNEGDIVSVDVGVAIDGGVGDSALTFVVGDVEVSAEVSHLLSVTRHALNQGLAQCRMNNRICDVSRAIEREGNRGGLGIVRDYVGHGCGTHLHEPPEVPNFFCGSPGPLLRPGMVLAVEPMFTLGTWKVKTDRINNWTVRTADGKWAAHFEHMVLITETEPEILTWPKTTC
ncbi:MAG: type I methionyl aminopeptidase [Victivallaceae bacterium]|nr:type I methionyl aminopeptidase [Victivallaceae bacterium]